jgi:hypothetical protein
MDQPEPSTITRMLTELCDHAERLERELELVREQRGQAIGSLREAVSLLKEARK